MYKTLAIALAGALVAGLTAVPAAESGTKNGVSSTVTYTQKRPNKPTGFKAKITGAPRTADGRLDPARRVIIRFHRGTKFNTKVPAVCTKRKLEQKGLRGCSKKSIVGTGKAEAISGIAALDPVKETITAVNGKNRIFFYLQGLQTAVLEGKIRGTRLDVTVPPFPIPGNDRGAVLTRFELTIKSRIRRTKRVRRRGRLVRVTSYYAMTPRTCRRSWTNKATFLYDNTSRISNIASSTRCRRR